MLNYPNKKKQVTNGEKTGSTYEVSQAKTQRDFRFLSSHFQKIKMTRRKMRQILIGPLLDDRLK